MMKYGGLRALNPRGIQDGESPDCRNEIISGNRLKTRPGIGKSFATALSSPINFLLNVKSGFCKENYKIAITRDGQIITSSIISKEWTSQADWDGGTKSQIITSGDVILAKGPGVYTLAGLPQSANVQGYWKFEEASGVLYDETANDNDGDYNGVLYQQAGAVDYALGFDGNDFVDCGSDASLPLNTDSFTVSALIKTTESGVSQGIATRFKGPTTPYGWQFLVSTNDKLLVSIMNTVGSSYAHIDSVGDVVNDGEWHLAAFVWDNEVSLKLYLDGVEIGSDTVFDGTKYTAAHDNVYIGVSDLNFFKGDIDEVVVWDKALTGPEVASLWVYYSNGYDRLKYDSGATDTDWTTYAFVADETPSGTNIKIRCRSASTEAGLASASWGSWLDATSGTLDCADNRWIEVEVYLETTDTSNTPTLNSLAINGMTPIG